MGNLINLLPVLLFLVGMLGISAYIQRSSKEDRQKNFAVLRHTSNCSGGKPIWWNISPRKS